MGNNLYAEGKLIGGATFQSHVNNSTTNDLIMDGNWDFVVLQNKVNILLFRCGKSNRKFFHTQIN